MPPSRRSDASLRADAVGLAVLAAAGGWAVVSSAVAGGDAGPTLTVYAAVAAAFLAARALTAAAPWLPPLALVVVGAAGVAVAGPGQVWTDAPLAGPFGYANLTGAAALAVAYAGALLAVTAPRRLRVLAVAVGVLASATAVSVTLATEARTAVAALLLAPLVVGVALRAGRRAAVLVAAGAAAAAVAGSVALAAAYPPPAALQPVVAATLSERRLELQHDALLLAGREPAVGVGGGRFAAESRAAAEDPDSPWAHHDLLQQAAEGGVPAALLLVALVAAAYGRLAADGAARAPSALSAAALTGLVLQTCTDHVLQAPAVPALTAALVAAGLRPRAEDSRSMPRGSSTT